MALMPFHPFANHWFPQVLDYGISLKLNDGSLGVRHLFFLLKVHLCLDCQSRGGAYTQSIIMQLLIVLYQKKKNLPSWRMLSAELSMFNEEAGEITFSQLARSCVGDTQKRKFAHMNRLYKLLHIYGDVEEDQLHDLGGDTQHFSSRRKVNPAGEEVQAVSAFIKGKLRELKAQQYLQYDGQPKSYLNRRHAMQNLKPIGVRTAFWMDDMVPQLRANIEKAKAKFYRNDWAGDYSTIWPECAIPAAEMKAIHPQDVDIFDDHAEDEAKQVDEDFEPEPDEGDVGDNEDDAEFEEADHDEAGQSSKGDGVAHSSRSDSEASGHDSNASEDHEDVQEGLPAVKTRINPSTFAVGESNILPTTRFERDQRGKRANDPNFAILTSFTSQTFQRKKRK